MNKGMLGLALMGGLIAAQAAQATVLESELHYARRLRDKTNLISMVDQLAMTQGSDAIKAFAKNDLADVTADRATLFATATTLAMPGVAMGAGGAGAPGGAGGPPGGGAPGGAGGPPGGGAGGPPGGGAGGPPGGGGAGGPPGGAPGGAGRGNGPGAANAAVVAGLKKLSGDDFDKAYLMTVLQISEDVERNVLGETLLPGANPDLAEFSKHYVVDWAKNADAAQRLLGVSGASGKGGPNMTPTFDANGHYAGVMAAGDLFGVVIK